MGTCGGRPPAAGKATGGAGGSAGGDPASPSAGWRVVVEVMGATEGASHR